MMLKTLFVVLYIVLASFLTRSRATSLEGLNYDVLLEDVNLVPLNKLDQYRYDYLRRKVLRVLPYLNYVKSKYAYLTDTIPLMGSRMRKKKRLYIRSIKKEIKQNLEKELKRLYVSEGRVLIHLIHRELGVTVYELLKEVRNGFAAFWYHTGARFYKLNLKDKFDAIKDRDDRLLDRIMIMEDLSLE